MIVGILGAIYTVLYMAGYLELADVFSQYWACCTVTAVGCDSKGEIISPITWTVI